MLIYRTKLVNIWHWLFLFNLKNLAVFIQEETEVLTIRIYFPNWLSLSGWLYTPKYYFSTLQNIFSASIFYT